MNSRTLQIGLAFSLCLFETLLHALPRSPHPPLPIVVPQLFQERFNGPYWARETNTAVTWAGVGTLVESGSGYALERRDTTLLPYVVPAVNVLATNERTRLQVATDFGALSFWFKPDWSSGGFNGTGSGPGEPVTLAELAVVGQKDFAVGFSLQVSADGGTVWLLGPGNPVAEVLLQAEINWRANEWQHLVLNYGPEGTELWANGERIAMGAATVTLPPEWSGLALGSGIFGNSVAAGEFEEFYTYRRLLDAKEIGFRWRGSLDELAMGPIPEAELAARKARSEKRRAEREALALSEESSGELQMLMLVGGTSVCVTSAPVYLTNLTCVFDTNQGYTATFEIQGSFDGSDTAWLYDVFQTSDLGSNQWVFLERGPSCSVYQYVGQPTNQSYYVLGTPLDTDGDSLTDAFEKLVSKTNPQLRDSDSDGIEDGDELNANGIPWRLEIARHSEVVVYTTAANATEGGACGQFRVLLPSPAPVGGVAVQYRLGGTAIFTNEFTVSPAAGSLTIPAGATSGNINICAINNSTYEDLDRYVEITLTNATGYTVNGMSAQVEIVDNDPPAVRVLALPPWVREPSSTFGTNAAMFYFIRDGAAAGGVTVNYNISGTATKDADYTNLPPFSIYMPPGVRTAELNLTLRADSLEEPDETIVLTLANASGYQLAPSNTTATIVIASNGLPPLPTVQVTASDNDAREAGLNPGQFTFTRAGGTTLPLRVYYRIGGTAEMGSTNSARDYVALPGYVDFAANATSTNVPVIPLDDAISEPAETIIVTLAGGEYRIGTNHTATVFLDDNEPTTWTATVTRHGIYDANAVRRRAAELRVTRTGTSLSTGVVPWSLTNGSPGLNKLVSSNVTGNIVGNNIILAAHQSVATVSCATTWQLYSESTGNVLFTLGSPLFQTLTLPYHPASHLVQVASITNPAVVVPEGSTVTGGLVFRRPYANANAFTAYFSASGSAVYGTNYTNHTSQPFQVNFPASQTAVSVNVQAFVNSQTNGWKTGVISFNPAYSGLQVPDAGWDRAFVRIRDAQISNPTADTDLDEDGIPDGYELANGLDPLTPNDPYSDPDHDGLGLIDEIQLGTNPNVADAAPVYPSEDESDYLTLRLELGAAGKLPLTTSCARCHEVGVRAGAHLRSSPRVTWEVTDNKVEHLIRFLRGTSYPVNLLANPYAQVLPSSQTNSTPQHYTATYTARFLTTTNTPYPFLTDTNQLLGPNRPMVLEQLGRTATLFAPDMIIAADADGDGVVNFTNRTDRTSAEKPFNFWINDDVDSGNDDAAEDLDPTTNPLNSSTAAIDNLRDLEDFARLQFRIDGMPGGFVTNANLQTRIYLTNLTGAPQIRIFPTAESNGGIGYLTNSTTGTAQKARAGLGLLSHGGPLTLSHTNWQAQSSNRFFLPMLFEGISTGRCVVVFALASNTGPALVTSRPFYLDLKPVTSLYEHWTVGNNITTEWDRIPAQATRTTKSAVFGSATTTIERDYVLFVHGWRMQPWRRMTFAETGFKRLWHLGYRGRYGFFSWPTDYVDEIYLPLNPSNYGRSEQRSWYSAPGLRRLLMELNVRQSGQVRIFAHSMGNVVVSEALRLEGARTTPRVLVHSYAASQAATVAHAYDAVNPETKESDFTTDTPEFYANYPFAQSNNVSFANMGKAVRLDIDSGKRATFNFHNFQDSATSGLWLFNQDLKPAVHDETLNQAWDYRRSSKEWKRYLTTFGVPHSGATLIPNGSGRGGQQYEIFARIAEARSPSLGAGEYNNPGHVSSVRGEISTGVNINKPELGIGGEEYGHSAQFRGINHHQNWYWQQLLQSFQITNTVANP